MANQGIVVLDTKNQAVVSDTRPQSQLAKKIVYDDSNFQCNKKLPNSQVDDAATEQNAIKIK